VKLIHLTSFGRELETALIPIAKELLSASVDDMDEEDVGTAISVLKKMEKNLLSLE
jgi:hypothetical protein